LLQFFELSIGSGDFSGRVPSREREMGMRSTVLRPMTALGQSLHARPSGKSGHVGYFSESGSKIQSISGFAR
jgi:hypothetical protein